MTNPNSPAFPLEPQWKYSALTKLEYFAAIAMQGYCANPNMTKHSYEQTASAAVNQAKALIKELNDSA